MAAPLTYVILVNWRGCDDTLACLASLRATNCERFKVLVVDNGSGDDSVSRIRMSFPEVEVLDAGANLGFAGGCNLGIRHALEQGCDYLWLLNNDTLVNGETMPRLLRIAEADPLVGAVGSVLYDMSKPKRIQAWGGGRVSFFFGGGWSIRKPRIPDYISGASMLIRRKALERVGLLDERLFFMYWEDVDLSFRLKKAGWRLAVAEDSVLWHREDNLQRTSLRHDLDYNVSAVRFFRRHSRLPAVPILVGVGGRLAKQALRGNLGRLFPICRAVVRAWLEPLPE